MSQKHKILYLILGIGIGIVLTNTLYLIYPKVDYIQLSDEEIIQKSRDLGMTSLKEGIKLKQPMVELSEKKSEKLSTEDIKVDNFIESEIEIKKGWTLQQVASELYHKKLINDEKEFNNFVKEKKLSTSIRVGKYLIRDDSSYDEIIEIITIKSK